MMRRPELWYQCCITGMCTSSSVSLMRMMQVPQPHPRSRKGRRSCNRRHHCWVEQTQQLPLDSPIGSKYRSIGLRSDGRLLFEGLSYDFENPNTKAGASFGVGSTIGILVYRDDSSVEVKNNIPTGSASVWLSFTINGSPIVSKGGLASSPAIFLYSSQRGVIPDNYNNHHFGTLGPRSFFIWLTKNLEFQCN